MNHTDGLIVEARPEVNRILSSGNEVAGRVNTLMTGLNEGKDAAGLLRRDDATKQQLQSTLSHVQAASTNLDEASARANETVTDFQSRLFAVRAAG